jgi:hypothetical protein
MTEASPLFGSYSYLFSTIETEAWATLDGEPDYVFTPVTSFGLDEDERIRNAQVYAGQINAAYQNRQRGLVKGNIVTPLFGWRPSGLTTSLAEFWLGWAAGQRGTKLPQSRAFEWSREDTANERHLGCRVNGFTLQGSEAGISLTIDVIGRTVEPFSTAQTLPNDMQELIEFLFDDSVVCTLNSIATNISQFSWQVQRPLTPNWENAALITGLPAGQRWTETFTVTKKKVDATWQTRGRTAGVFECPLVLTLKGVHQGTGTGGTNYAKATITMPRLSLTSVKEQGSPNELTETLTFNVLKPQSSSAASAVTWSEVS